MRASKGTHQDLRITLLKSSQQKLLRWIKQATGFVGDDTQKRCAQGIKFIVKEAIESNEDALNGWRSSRWQMDRRVATEALLEALLKDYDGNLKEADEYVRKLHYESPGMRAQKEKEGK